MDWYYVINNRRYGPVSELRLEELRRAGELHEDTFVWRDGMKDWRPLQEALAQTQLSENHRMCVECRKLFPQSELVPLNHSWVCAECKPRFLQKIMEGLVPALGVGEVWRRGRQLVFHAETPFPDRCIRCNAPANGYRQRCYLFWAPTGRFVLTRRRLEIRIGLCERHRRIRDRVTVGCLIGALLGGAVLIFGIIQDSSYAAAGFLLAVLGLTLAGLSRTLVTATKITDEIVWLRGAGKPFLADLLEWSGDR